MLDLPATATSEKSAGPKARGQRGEAEMNHLSRSYQKFGIVALSGMAAVVLAAPHAGWGQSGEIVQLMAQEPSPALGHSASSQGYLGVDVADLDQEKAQTLKLKEVRGAVITLIDHDAPAGQIGLKVNDVVLQLNGQNVEGSEQLRRMLKEIPPGRKVSIAISRDGNIQTMAVELADRQVLGHDVWNKIGNDGAVSSPPPSMGILSGGGDAPMAGGGFHLPFFGSSLNVGVMVEPLTSQMAEYLGVPSGLMVKQVARKSEAATAGLKAFDVILKVGSETVTNLAGWDRTLRSNLGKPVPVTVLRDKKQLTLTLQVDSKHKGSLEIENLFPSSDCPLMAELSQEFAENPIAAAAAAEALRNSLNPEDFKIDPKQIEQLRQQMEEFRNNFNPDDFKIDPKQMDELKRQIEQMRALRFGDYV